jgi:selenocysteine-specific elongation factor
MQIVGTAGHVDHGKSSLVSALTGTNPDRWLEEQVRGMTLDLGFAHLQLGDGLEAGIVDVPGHERFLHNMLAGAAGMDVLLLAVDANEGVMPQTVEHLEILKYLNVRRTIVALTKTDLLTPERLDAARAAIEASLRGTLAEGAPAIGVSTVTGAGLEELRAEIAAALRSLPPRNAEAPVYLPIDRVFTLMGIGTVVTGTLMQGRIRAGDVLTLQPSGQTARVRSLQIFGAACQEAAAGARVALNVPSIGHRAIARGEAAVNAEFAARSDVVVRFTPLEAALPLLRRRTPVHVYLGSAEILGTLELEEIAHQAVPVRARLRLRTPAAVFPGVRFVVRRPSPRTLLGGGHVEGTDVAGADTAMPPAQQAALAALHERGLAPVDVREIAADANLRESTARQALDALVERGDAIRVARPAAYVDAAAAGTFLAGVLAYLEELHRQEPWAMGATSLAIARAMNVPEQSVVRVLSAYADDGRLIGHAGYFAALGFTPKLTVEQRALFESLVPVEESNPLLPAAFEDAAAAVKRASGIAGAGKAFDMLLARGSLVKIGEALYRGTQIAQIRARLEEFFRTNQRMTASEFRDLLGTSRKYAVPLLEWLDARGITLRSGDHRTLRKRGA